MPASLKDVARLAGVNASTASRALRHDPTQRINAETRERVLEAAATLGYRPNYLGRSLRTKRTGTLGLVVPNLDFFTFVDITHGVQAAAISHDRSLLLVEVDQFADATGDLTADELIHTRLIAEGRVDGLVVGSRTLPDDTVRALAQHQAPVVLVNRRAEGIISVSGHDERACRMALEHVASFGHRRVAMVSVGITGEDIGARREGAYHAAVADLGLDPDPDLVVHSAMSDEDGRRAVIRLIEQTAHDPPTALFIGSLSIALGVLEGLRANAVGIPDDISVVTFPDHKVAAHTAPPLTTVSSSLFEMGRVAGELLIHIIDGGTAESVVLLDTYTIVDRGSVAPVAGAIARRRR
jgi:LacI family transcriptional regulator